VYVIRQSCLAFEIVVFQNPLVFDMSKAGGGEDLEFNTGNRDGMVAVRHLQIWGELYWRRILFRLRGSRKIHWSEAISEAGVRNFKQYVVKGAQGVALEHEGRFRDLVHLSLRCDSMRDHMRWEKE